MRFHRYDRSDDYKATPHTLAAARRHIARETARHPLFPEFAPTYTAEERVETIAKARKHGLRDARNFRAKDWRRARAELRGLPALKRAAVVRFWNTGLYPADPGYLLVAVGQAKRGVCFWHKLAELRRLALIRDGLMPRPESWPPLRGK
jgi:hypothetical protein